MREGSIQGAIADASDVAVASLVQRLWEARGYETALRFSGPDLHVEAVGETDEGATRTVRTWVGADGATERNLRVFVNACERDEEEPHVVAVRGGLDRGAVPPGVATFEASGLAVELREAGADPDPESAVDAEADADAADADAETDPDTDWLGDPAEAGDGDGDSEDDDGDGEGEAVDRRGAMKTVGTYLVTGLGGYLAVERLSDFVQSSPEFRAAVRRRVADVRARLPAVELPSFDAGGTTDRSRGEEAVPSPQSAADGDRPADAARVPYHELAADPAAYTGENVRYEGTVDAVREREETFEIRLRVAATAADEWADAVACRWRVGALFDDTVSVRLLENEAVTVWGVVRGETRATRYGRAVPLLELLDVARTDG